MQTLVRRLGPMAVTLEETQLRLDWGRFAACLRLLRRMSVADTQAWPHTYWRCWKGSAPLEQVFGVISVLLVEDYRPLETVCQALALLEYWDGGE